MEKGTFHIKTGFAEMFKGGVIMDVTTPEQAVIAEAAGAVAVVASLDIKNGWGPRWKRFFSRLI